MTLRSQTLLLALVVACGVSCQVPDGRIPAHLPMHAVQPVAGAADVAVRIGSAGMAVKTLGKTFDDVATIVVTLKDGAAATVTSPGLANPITITLPTLTGTFTGVPPGTGYTIDIEARDASGTSITGNTRAGNSVDVAAGVATYSSGSALTKTVDLSAGTASTDATSSAITPATGTSLTFDRFKWMLVNNRSKWTDTSSIQATAAAIAISNVQPGAISGPTHDLWMFAGQAAPMKALPVQRVAAASNGAGTVPNPINGTMAPVTLTTPTATALTPADGLPMTADDAGNVYYVNAANQVIKLDSSNGYAALPPLFTAGVALTGFTTDGTGNVYYSTGTDILVRRPPDYAADETLITASDVRQIAVDEYRNLYWTNASNHLTYAKRVGLTYQTVTGFGTPLVVGAVTMLAADAFGHVYMSDGTNIIRRNRSSYGFWAGEGSGGGPTFPSATTVVMASNISGFAVDRAGDVYFTQTGSNELKLVPRGGANTDHYTVAGGGTVATAGLTAMTGDPLTIAEFLSPRRPAVSPLGVLFCTTPGDGGNDQLLRRIAPGPVTP